MGSTFYRGSPLTTTAATSTATDSTDTNSLTGLFSSLAAANQSAQQSALAGRIPGLAGLEQSSSNAIAGLLNPPAFFTDTDRKATELAAGRGVGGSAQSFGVGLKMTDEERLKRLTLGQNMLSQATARNPIAELPDILQTILTPAQKEQYSLAQQGLTQDQAKLDETIRQNKAQTALAERELAAKYGTKGQGSQEDDFIKTFLYGSDMDRSLYGYNPIGW